MKKTTKRVDGVGYSYYQGGSGRSLFLIPAFHSDIRRFKPFLDYLETMFHVYVSNLPGIGTPDPLPSGCHTIDSYAEYFSGLLRALKLRNYILSGLCLGGSIAVRMLVKNSVTKPSHALFFETLYRGDMIHLDWMHSVVKRILLFLGPAHPVSRGFADFVLHNETFLTWYFRRIFRKEKKLRKVLAEQLRLTTTMNTQAWLDVLTDLFGINLAHTHPFPTIPATLVYNTGDDIVDTDGMIAGMKRLFPQNKVLLVTLPRHAPAGPIDRAYVIRVIAPLEQQLRGLSYTRMYE